MGTIKKTKFQVFNGSDYDTKYFETSADQVKMDDGSTVQDILLKVYPVGAIYMSTTNVNPGTLFGGTWVAWGAGRVPVGINTGDTDFNTAEKTGGAKTVNLTHKHTVNGHTHTINHTHTVNAHTHSTAGHAITVDEMPQHGHYIGTRGVISWPNTGNAEYSFGTWDPNEYPYVEQVEYTGQVGGGAAHSHGNTGSAAPATGGASTGSSGSASPETGNNLSGAQSIMQPYITCYMWKRTA